MWASWVNVAIGVWLMVSPYIIRTTLVTHHLIVGAAIIVLGYLGAQGNRWASWVNVALGVWLVVAPFILVTTGATSTNMMIVGVAVAVLGWVAASMRPQQNVQS